MYFQEIHAGHVMSVQLRQVGLIHVELAGHSVDILHLVIAGDITRGRFLAPRTMCPLPGRRYLVPDLMSC